MSIAQERTIRNYIYQMRTAFSLQEVHENTDVPKTSAFRIIHKLLENGEIEKTGASISPQRYKAVIKVVKPPRKEREHARKDEVEAKAQKLGVSTKTVYLIEKRVAEGKIEDPFIDKEPNQIYPYMESIISETDARGKITLKEVARLLNCDAYKAYVVLDHMEAQKILKSADGFFILNRRIS